MLFKIDIKLTFIFFISGKSIFSHFSLKSRIYLNSYSPQPSFLSHSLFHRPTKPPPQMIYRSTSRHHCTTKLVVPSFRLDNSSLRCLSFGQKLVSPSHRRFFRTADCCVVAPSFRGQICCVRVCAQICCVCAQIHCAQICRVCAQIHCRFVVLRSLCSCKLLQIFVDPLVHLCILITLLFFI